MALVLDTCVVVAAVKSAGGASRALVDLAVSGEVEIVLTAPLLYQYEDVLYRPENQVAGFTETDIDALCNSLLARARLVSGHFSHRPALVDEGDELVLQAAIWGQADIVTFNLRDFRGASRFDVRVGLPGAALRAYYDRHSRPYLRGSYGEK
jgi:predicted nucleic acid-binding protein